MAHKFKAKKLDLDLELTTLSGEIVMINGPEAITGMQAAQVIDRMIQEESSAKAKIEAAEAKAKKDGMPTDSLSVFQFTMNVQLMADQLSAFYPEKDAEFFYSNFDQSTLLEIKQWLVGQLRIVQKK